MTTIDLESQGPLRGVPKCQLLLNHGASGRKVFIIQDCVRKEACGMGTV